MMDRNVKKVFYEMDNKTKKSLDDIRKECYFYIK